MAKNRPIKAYNNDAFLNSKDGRTLLAIPKRVRGAKAAGDSVNVELSFTAL
jgi:hypothetical protein